MGESTTIVHAILTIAGVLLASVFAVYVMGRLGYLNSVMTNIINLRTEELRIYIKILTGFYNSTEGVYVIYVKNLGDKPMPLEVLNSTDVFLGTYGEPLKLFTYGNGSVGTFTVNELDNDGIWNSGETLIFKINTGGELESPVHIKIVLPTGSTAEEVLPG